MDIITGRTPPPARAESQHSKGSRELALRPAPSTHPGGLGRAPTPLSPCGRPRLIIFDRIPPGEPATGGAAPAKPRFLSRAFFFSFPFFFSALTRGEEVPRPPRVPRQRRSHLEQVALQVDVDLLVRIIFHRGAIKRLLAPLVAAAAAAAARVCGAGRCCVRVILKL